jgi:phosphoribosylaminoimidazole carboxylase PurE protein
MVARLSPLVGVVMGSDSDLPVMREASETLESFEVPFETTIASAHRSPERSAAYAAEAKKRGLKVIIAGAGMAAHLAGVMAAGTTLPVIGVPMAVGPFQGFDALLSTVQMPPGVPVATVGLGSARNAALLAVQILALSDPALAEKLVKFKRKLAQGVEEKAERLQQGG